jgi:hypothetical protein
MRGYGFDCGTPVIKLAPGRPDELRAIGRDIARREDRFRDDDGFTPLGGHPRGTILTALALRKEHRRSVGAYNGTALIPAMSNLLEA